ncbi:unnamed protein product [Rotaria sordida]|uniref:Uncharacterized protein n=1 Tax=Rotaria sordida TaxID=392033 RepID=A0A814TLS2_9BILA|nr:unnamed protein product [Rotaria sordida]CAF1163887.1 unnamed protein product [Rotaria sordida]
MRQPQYPNINFGPSIPPPLPQVPPSSNTPRIGFNIDTGTKSPFIDPFPQVPSAQDHSTPPPPPPAMNDSSNDPGFDDLARRFEELKKRK